MALLSAGCYKTSCVSMPCQRTNRDSKTVTRILLAQSLLRCTTHFAYLTNTRPDNGGDPATPTLSARDSGGIRAAVRRRFAPPTGSLGPQTLAACLRHSLCCNCTVRTRHEPGSKHDYYSTAGGELSIANLCVSGTCLARVCAKRKRLDENGPSPFPSSVLSAGQNRAGSRTAVLYEKYSDMA